MSKMLSYLKAAGGEASLMTRLGFWRKAVGTVQDALVGGTARAWAAIPYIEPANNAMIVVRA
ncbi:MAG: hypothetical protein AMXMBFR56_67870 [Polyangiaceae bacterium]